MPRPAPAGLRSSAAAHESAVPTSPSVSSIEATPTAFPARTKQAADLVEGIRTDITATWFADKILLLISQEGRLAHWVHVPLESADPTLSDRRRQISEEEDGSDLLPLPHLTATTILGGGGGDDTRDTVGRLIAAQVATTLASKNPEERRLLVVGMGLKKAMFEPEGYIKIVQMAVSCLS